MDKLNAYSFVFFIIALTAGIIDYTFEYMVESPEYFNEHFQQVTFLVIVVSPMIGSVLGWYGKRGEYRLVAIASNTIFFIAFAPLAFLNFWIMTFGIW